jgi:hypothetical protein
VSAPPAPGTDPGSDLGPNLILPYAVAPAVDPDFFATPLPDPPDAADPNLRSRLSRVSPDSFSAAAAAAAPAPNAAARSAPPAGPSANRAATAPPPTAPRSGAPTSFAAHTPARPLVTAARQAIDRSPAPPHSRPIAAAPPREPSQPVYREADPGDVGEDNRLSDEAPPVMVTLYEHSTRSPLKMLLLALSFFGSMTLLAKAPRRRDEGESS